MQKIMNKLPIINHWDRTQRFNKVQADNNNIKILAIIPIATIKEINKLVRPTPIILEILWHKIKNISRGKGGWKINSEHNVELANWEGQNLELRKINTLSKKSSKIFSTENNMITTEPPTANTMLDENIHKGDS